MPFLFGKPVPSPEKGNRMEIAALEANWGWDSKLGSIPFKRPRLSDENIKAQRRLAGAGKLIHWAGHRGKCVRARKKTDVTVDRAGKTTVTHTAEAGHIENVNCLCCRKLFFGPEGKRIRSEALRAWRRTFCPSRSKAKTKRV